MAFSLSILLFFLRVALFKSNNVHFHSLILVIKYTEITLSRRFSFAILRTGTVLVSQMKGK